MTTDITTLEIAGNPINFTDVEYEIYISHGRSSVFDGASPSTASLTLIAQGSSLPFVDVDDPVWIQAEGIDRFQGEVTDISITHLIDGFARINIQCVGALGLLGRRYGLRWYSSVSNNMTAWNRAWLINTGFVPVPFTDIDGGFTLVEGFVGTPGERLNQLSWITELADWVGGAVIDKPSGRPYVQFYDSRRLTTYYYRWIDERQTYQSTWQATSSSETWANQFVDYGTSETPLTLDPTKVMFAPTWTVQSGNVINRVELEWVGGNVVSGSSDDSVRVLTLSTRIADSTQATARAAKIISNQNIPRYALGSIEIMMDEITDPAERDELLGLIAGRRIEVTNLPDPTPAASYTGILEGWSETFIGLGGTKGSHRLTLSLSDPNYSLN